MVTQRHNVVSIDVVFWQGLAGSRVTQLLLLLPVHLCVS
jgi:hypothetical protein